MPFGFCPLPAASAYRIGNARVPSALAAGLGPETDDLVTCNIVVENGRISRLGPTDTETDTLPVLDLDQGLALPRFVDVHTHLDKGHIWGRSPNSDGSFLSAREAVTTDRETRWSVDDVRARMEFALRCAFAHGTGAIRTHIDSIGKQTGISWPVFAELREAWKDRIILQASALFPIDIAAEDEEQFKGIVAAVARYGGALGGVTFLGEKPGRKLDLALERMFSAAIANGLDLDLHVDESASSDARTLEIIVNTAIRHRFKGRLLAGHCCSLALASDADRARIIDLIGESRTAVVSLPMCNMYLQDRNSGRTPRWRGVAPLHELDAAGIPVMIASDNTRDPFYAYGDLDMLEVFREGTRILQLDHSERPWTRMLGTTSADFMGLKDHGRLRVGGPADFVLTRARTLQELISRPQSDRVVVMRGRAIDTSLPDYRELDKLYS